MHDHDAVLRPRDAANYGRDDAIKRCFFWPSHDVFCFTMLQEMVATALGLELGEYIHFAGSMHIYTRAEDDGVDYTEKAAKYIEAGLQRFGPMSPMPEENPFELTAKLLELEAKIRNGEWVEAADAMASVYWADIVRLIQVFWAKKLSNDEWLARLEADISKPLQRYVKRRKRRA